MKSLKYLVLSLSLCAAVAHAQGNQPQGDTASNPGKSDSSTVAQSAGRAAPQKQAQKKDECVGPVSFCNIYFGS